MEPTSRLPRWIASQRAATHDRSLSRCETPMPIKLWQSERRRGDERGRAEARRQRAGRAVIASPWTHGDGPRSCRGMPTRQWTWTRSGRELASRRISENVRASVSSGLSMVRRPSRGRASGRPSPRFFAIGITPAEDLRSRGGGGIRTHGTVAGTPAFRAGQFSHSCTPPGLSGTPNATPLRVWSARGCGSGCGISRRPVRGARSARLRFFRPPPGTFGRRTLVRATGVSLSVS